MSSNNEGLRIARLLMVLSSISPLFVLWAIRGGTPLPDGWFIALCLLMVLGPNAFLSLRIGTAKKLKEQREIVVGTFEDHRDHILVYLFAMLLPFYAADLGQWRDFAAGLAALVFIIFLFWHLNLHYMNIWFAWKGYRVFTIYPPADENLFSGKGGLVLITKRVGLTPGERLAAFRISDTVYLEDPE